MLHYSVYIIAGVVVVGLILGSFWPIRHHEEKPEILPPLDDRTHFYEAIRPGQGLPPVPPTAATYGRHSEATVRYHYPQEW